MYTGRLLPEGDVRDRGQEGGEGDRGEEAHDLHRPDDGMYAYIYIYIIVC